MISLGRLRILGPVTIRAPTKIVLKSERWTQDKHNANFNCRTHWTHQGLKTAQLLQFKFLWLKQKPVGLHELVRWITICIAGSSLPTSSGLRALLHKFSRFISRLWNVIGWNSTIKVSGLCVQSPVTPARRLSLSAQRRRPRPRTSRMMLTELETGSELCFPTCDALKRYVFNEEKDILIDDETDLVGVVMVFGCGNIWLWTYLDRAGLSWVTSERGQSVTLATGSLRQGQHTNFYQNNFSFSWSHP